MSTVKLYLSKRISLLPPLDVYIVNVTCQVFSREPTNNILGSESQTKWALLKIENKLAMAAHSVSFAHRLFNKKCVSFSISHCKCLLLVAGSYITVMCNRPHAGHEPNTIRAIAWAQRSVTSCVMLVYVIPASTRQEQIRHYSTYTKTPKQLHGAETNGILAVSHRT